MKGLKIFAVIMAVGAVIVVTVVIRNFMTGLYPAFHHVEAVRPAVPVHPANTPRVVHRLEFPNVKPREFRVMGPDSALALNAREPETEGRESNCSLLLRELARQTVLIAARDGIGVPTRDRTLREGSPGALIDPDAVPAGAQALEIRTSAERGKALRLWVSRAGKSGATEKLFDKEIPLPVDAVGIIDYAAVTSSLEASSRNEIPAALRKAGFSGMPPTPAKGPGEREIREIEARLGDLSLVSQFSAVRQAHASIRASGESPQMLGALVRGYANLGELSQFLWSATHKDFKARSLLYAQRMVAEQPGSADALRHRAHARALAGLHALALADLDEADRLDETNDGHGVAPAWAELIRAFCRYDTAALSDTIAGQPKEAPLASYLCFLTVERCESENAMMGFGRVALDANPLCLRVVDAMCERGGVIAGHNLTQLGPAVLVRSLATELPAIPGLPQSVRDALPKDPQGWADPAAQASVASALVEAGANDTTEPSWTVLGRMVQEAQFVHVWRRAMFLREFLGVDAADFVRESRPLVAGHPYAGLMDVYAVPPEQDVESVAEQVKDLEVIDAEYTEVPMVDSTNRAFRSREGGPVIAGAAHFRVVSHGDDLAPELDYALSHMTGPGFGGTFRLGLARRADAISPFMPSALASHIETDWEHVAPRAAQIEAHSGSNPTIGAALARQYKKLGKIDDAVRVLKRYLKISPDYSAYEMLAECYLDRGDEAAWLQTMEQSLTLDDYALDHSRINKDIALHFMAAGRYDRAEPYATASAQSGADWAMLTASECYAGLGKWDQAEEMVHDDALRYGSVMYWYEWCVSSGHGHLAEASTAAQEYLAGVAGSTDRDTILEGAIYLLGQGKTDEPMAKMQQMAHGGDPWPGLHAALWRLGAGDQAGCDAMLHLVVTKGRHYQVDHQESPELVHLGELFVACRSAGPTAKLDLSEVDKTVDKTEEGKRANLLYFTAKFLELRGQEEQAQRYYSRCIATVNGGAWNRMLAAMELRKRGIDPMAARFAKPSTRPATTVPS